MTKTHRSIYLIFSIILLSACEVRMAPTEYFSKLFRTQTDSRYYQIKSEHLTNQVAKDIEEYEIDRITIVDFVDEGNRVSILGEYLSSRIIEAFTSRSLFHNRTFRVTQKGEVNEILKQLKLKHNYLYAKK